MHQVSKPRPANHSIAEESGRPGTCRSKVGCDAIEEPCTKRIVPLAFPCAFFSQRKSRTSPFWVQCSMPFMLRFYARIGRLTEGERMDTFPKLLMHHAQV